MRPVDAVGLASGAAMLAAPDRVLRAVHGSPGTGAEAVVRVLGARQVVQALTLAARPSRPLRALGAVVDSLHALSMVGLAAVDEDQRGPASASGLLAGTLAVWGGATIGYGID